MSVKSTPERYGSVAIAIHWLTAVAILGLLVSGSIIEDMRDPAEKVPLLRVHVIVGVTVLVLTLFRIVWWVAVDRRPPPSAATPRWQAIAAHAVHGMLYLVIVVMVASGVAMIALSGATDTLFGGGSAALPDFAEYAPRGPHGLGASALWLLVIVHVFAALYHQFVLRDRLLARIGLGRAQRS